MIQDGPSGSVNSLYRNCVVWSGAVAPATHRALGHLAGAMTITRWQGCGCRNDTGLRVWSGGAALEGRSQPQDLPTSHDAIPMSLARSLTSSMVVLAGGRVLSILLALVTVAMLTRALGPEDFGYFRTAIAYLSLAMLIGGFGLNTVVVRELARAEADQPRILGNALALRLTLSATAITVGCLLAWLLPFDLFFVI